MLSHHPHTPPGTCTSEGGDHDHHPVSVHPRRLDDQHPLALVTEPARIVRRLTVVDDLPDIAVTAITAAVDLVRWDQELSALNSEPPISRLPPEA